ncbi:hypothetical protein GCM10010425_01830 [Streptomyces spororaveus]|uniref:Uncharacterized protein n=1 Tax=Streptomyces spororaveus TaxID=284039 RepID=A0ABQ3TCQ9_9ACTN|nr:hypothetical protein Sspor_37620 [Streptomyces spororaveus]
MLAPPDADRARAGPSACAAGLTALPALPAMTARATMTVADPLLRTGGPLPDGVIPSGASKPCRSPAVNL